MFLSPPFFSFLKKSVKTYNLKIVIIYESRRDRKNEKVGTINCKKIKDRGPASLDEVGEQVTWEQSNENSGKRGCFFLNLKTGEGSTTCFCSWFSVLPFLSRCRYF